MIPYGCQDIDDKDIEEVIKVLKSAFITQGSKPREFETNLSQYTGAKYSVVMNSATSALHSACLALGLGKGDFLWTSPNTFVASANCGVLCGASIDFIDIDPLTYNMDPHILEEKLVKAKSENKLPKIIIPVHYAGQSCEMKKIYELSKEYGFKIIEDASHAIGGNYMGHPVGSCKYSDVTVFSFHPVKIITTGEGGACMTNNSFVAEKIRRFASHGITKNQNFFTEHNEGDWYYEQQSIGLNYRMTDIAASLGITQLEKISEFINKRHAISQKYNATLKNLPITLPFQSDNCFSSLHLYPIQINSNKTDKSREYVFKELRKAKIGVNVHYIPVHLHPFYKKKGFKYGDYQNAESFYEKEISLPIFSKLTDENQEYVIEKLIEIF